MGGCPLYLLVAGLQTEKDSLAEESEFELSGDF
jgi:hypothetical protein